MMNLLKVKQKSIYARFELDLAPFGTFCNVDKNSINQQ
jgi:hypothetical protein